MLYLVSISQNLTIKWLGQIVECQHWLHFLSLVVQFEILDDFAANDGNCWWRLFPISNGALTAAVAEISATARMTGDLLTFESISTGKAVVSIAIPAPELRPGSPVLHLQLQPAQQHSWKPKGANIGASNSSIRQKDKKIQKFLT